MTARPLILILVVSGASILPERGYVQEFGASDSLSGKIGGPIDPNGGGDETR